MVAGTAHGRWVRKSYLMIWKNERVSYNDVFPSRSVEYHNFSNIFWCKGFTAAVRKLACLSVGDWSCSRVDRIGFGFIAIKPYDREFGLHLAWIYLHYSYSRSNQLSSHGICETSYGRLCCAVDRAAWVWFSACYRPDIDYVSSPPFLTLLVYRKNGLSHVDQASDVGGKHDINVFISNVWGLCCTFNETTERI